MSRVKLMNREVSADILIPEEKVAVFIGRAGSNLKEVEQRTNTKITFRTESNISFSKKIIIL
jgi:transcription antitermination factor NusA-like protein